MQRIEETGARRRHLVGRHDQDACAIKRFHHPAADPHAEMSGIHRDRRTDQLGTLHLQVIRVRFAGKELIHRDWRTIIGRVGDPPLVVEQRISRIVTRIDLAELLQPNLDVAPTMPEDSDQQTGKPAEEGEFQRTLQVVGFTVRDVRRQHSRCHPALCYR